MSCSTLFTKPTHEDSVQEGDCNPVGGTNSPISSPLEDPQHLPSVSFYVGYSQLEVLSDTDHLKKCISIKATFCLRFEVIGPSQFTYSE